jgi:hypothetical protein
VAAMACNLIVSAEDVRQFYDCKLKLHSDGHVTFRKYERTLNFVPSGYEPLGISKPSLNAQNEPETQKKEHGLKSIRPDNLTRSRSLLIDLAYSNSSTFHSFVTLTFAENVTSVTLANKEFHKWVKAWERKKPDFAYLAVPEFQKRGAVHYHILSNLVCGEDIPEFDPIRTYNKEKKKFFDIKYHDVPYWKHGFSSAFDLSLTDENFDIAAYMTKYMYKDIDNRLYAHQKILHSNNLVMPEVYRKKSDNKLNKFVADMFSKYKISSYEFQAVEKYQVSFFQMSVKLSADDMQSLKDFLGVASYTNFVGISRNDFLEFAEPARML